MPRKKRVSSTKKATTKKKTTTTKKTVVNKPKVKPITKLYGNDSLYTVHPVSDMERAKTFYETVLELEKNFEAPAEMGWCEYKLPVKGAYLGISLSRKKEFIPVNVLNITTTNLEEIKTVLETKKVKTSDIIDIPDMISMFTIQDPDKNTISFIETRWLEPSVKS
ncbi:MAG: VOC family protein [Promethearchaeota archaeon]